MTPASCSHCRLRFTSADAAYLPGCPECGGPLQPLAGPQAALGLRLFRVEDSAHALPEAVAVAIPPPRPQV